MGFSHGLPDAPIRMWTKTVLVPGDINEGKLGGLFFMGSVEQLTSLCYDVNKAIRNGRNNGMERMRWRRRRDLLPMIFLVSLLIFFPASYENSPTP